MTIQVKIINKLETKVKEYQERTGASKTWIAGRIGISKQRFYELYKAENFYLDTLARLAFILECDIKDLVEIKIEEK